jgi:hypothetical protein
VNRVELEIKNAKIVSTSLGVEDHGIFTAYLHLDGGGWGGGFGGYSLDGPVKDTAGKFEGRVGSAFGAEFIRRVLETLEVETWEKLPGTIVRVTSEGLGGRAATTIGHAYKDRWFDPQKLADEMRVKRG